MIYFFNILPIWMYSVIQTGKGVQLTTRRLRNAGLNHLFQTNVEYLLEKRYFAKS